MYQIFDDRRDAGRALAHEIQKLKLENPLVLGLPRGGIPVAYEVAKAIGASLDAIVVRKLGAPFQPELAVGAIASGNIRVFNEKLVAQIGSLDHDVLKAIEGAERKELKRREKAYRGERPFPDLSDKDVILVDDGIATGATMHAAVEAVRTRKPASVVVAVPTASTSAARSIESMVDELVCLETPAEFYAVGQFYVNFGQTTDDEVRDLLRRAEKRSSKGTR